jgi:hypothetical protein
LVALPHLHQAHVDRVGIGAELDRIGRLLNGGRAGGGGTVASARALCCVTVRIVTPPQGVARKHRLAARRHVLLRSSGRALLTAWDQIRKRFRRIEAGIVPAHLAQPRAHRLRIGAVADRGGGLLDRGLAIERRAALIPGKGRLRRAGRHGLIGEAARNLF